MTARARDGGRGVAEAPRPRGPTRVLVIGYGNALRTDDGVGWHAARMLVGDPRLGEAGVVAEHQLEPELAFDMSTAGLVILVDASTATPPGTVTVRRLAEPAGVAPAAGPGASSHHIDPELLLALARELYGAAPEAFVVSVGVAEMGPGESLTPPVGAALPAVADTVARLIAEHAGRVAGRPRESA